MDTETEVVPCGECGKVLKGRKAYQYHKRVHEMTACDFCGIPVTKMQISRHELKCSGAGKENIFKCDECEYKTCLTQNIRRHIGSVHGKTLDPKNLQCMLCPKGFSNKANLKKHMMNEHERKKVFSNIGFGTFVIDYKPAPKDDKCPHCEYTSKINLKRHMKKHDVVVEKKKETCDLCDYTTTKSSNLKRHMQETLHKKEPSTRTKWRQYNKLKKDLNIVKCSVKCSRTL